MEPAGAGSRLGKTSAVGADADDATMLDALSRVAAVAASRRAQSSRRPLDEWTL